MLDKSQILAVPVKVEIVSVPEWGGDVFVREFSGKSRAEIIAFLADKRKLGPSEVEASTSEVFPLVVRISACDDKGELLFDAAEVATLYERSGRALERVAMAAMKLNGLTSEAGKEAKATF